MKLDEPFAFFASIRLDLDYTYFKQGNFKVHSDRLIYIVPDSSTSLWTVPRIVWQYLWAATLDAVELSALGAMDVGLFLVIAGGLLLVYSMWWLYFYRHVPQLMTSFKIAFSWGYGHSLIFASTAAVGAGLAVVIDQVTHHAELSAAGAGMAVALPSAIFVFSLWILQEQPRAKNAIDTLVHPVTAVLILMTPFTEQAVPLTGILLAILVAIRLVRHLE
jgi:F0F1-type ATP synthase assembly protein I